MKVELMSPPSLTDPSVSDNSSDQLDLGSMEISIEKLALVLGITFGFIFLMLLSLICIFYVMGFLQNVFGYSWAGPMGRTISTPHFYPDEIIISTDGNSSSQYHSRCPSRQSHKLPCHPGSVPFIPGVVQSC